MRNYPKPFRLKFLASACALRGLCFFPVCSVRRYEPRVRCRCRGRGCAHFGAESRKRICGSHQRRVPSLPVLKEKQISYVVLLHSDQVLVHPKNRGGLLINPLSAHRNGSAICSSGANLKELHGAVAFELQVDPQLKQAAHTGSIQ